ncbi:Lipopolysaccharide kinase (Kdo/WaaP) family protein [Malonomonas rubra DSM 5091]|uniref:Lipopolysaccharide kinase (Kdo/WaaP) family protein n=1 Tax=Malonomonas rubra DSM 5091 TaxID=1122189 RepID=A0A1M6C7M1_MALRU|nr:lipopolysaccharide kinase InaA family protein [Malonomonas rubra]SHI57037.1 Lipopolysaccharide kinase (Kdo/WaaP) family protein [Malonomonas rubra DSM 5091]
MKTSWTFLGEETEYNDFGSLMRTAELDGECISKDPISLVKKLTIQNTTYYIKEYTRNGKGVRHYLGRGRLQGEWENLFYFSQLGIPIPRIVAYGQQTHLGLLKVGFLVTAEVPQAWDLRALSIARPQLFSKGRWLEAVIRQTADYTRRLHQHGFVHRDLKWRNVLVSAVDHESPKVYFFDCPLGREWFGWLKQRGAIKDLACLDTIGKKVLSRSRRLYFFLQYRNVKRLSVKDKEMICRLLNFFPD